MNTTNTTLVFDACALIAFFKDEAGAEIVEDLLGKSERNEIDIIINVINCNHRSPGV